jgi:cytochrome c-type biogenesis protein CcmF
VENASLIPWLVLLAAMHTMILNKKRNHSYGLSYLFVFLAFLLSIYASYLTRSGVLGETSAHAFGNNGLSTQMIAILFTIIAVFLSLYFKNLKNFPSNNKDEFLSREFWMYIGSLVLVLSAFQILISTSIPVINAVFGTTIAPPPEREAFYNKWQLPFAVIVMFLTSISLALKYGKNDFPGFIKRYGIILLISNVLFVAEIYLFEISTFSYLIFLLSTNVALVSSIDFFIRNKFDTHNLSNSLSHLGFALFLLGVLVAFSNSEIISSNTSKYDLGDQTSNKENQLLIKNQKKQLKSYQVNYVSFKRDRNHLYYGVDFYEEDTDGNLKKAFHIQPSINVNDRMGNVYDPDTYHSFTKDVFTYITYADIKGDLSESSYKELFEKEMVVGDTIRVNDVKLILDSIRIEKANGKISVDNVGIIAQFISLNENGESENFELAYRIKDKQLIKEEKNFDNNKLRIKFLKISPKTNGIVVGLDEKRLEFIVVKSTVFPYISVMWLGVFITLLGLGISLIRNIRIK